MLVWPTLAEVDGAVREWARQVAARQPDLRRLGYFGSYARGDWGVGSDLDVVAIVAASDEPHERRVLRWDMTPLPVPADLLIFTDAEWTALMAGKGRFGHMLARDTVWVFAR